MTITRGSFSRLIVAMAQGVQHCSRGREDNYETGVPDFVYGCEAEDS